MAVVVTVRFITGSTRLHQDEMLASRYVRLELVAVSSLVSANIAFEGITESVASGMDSEHYMIQEDTAAMGADVRLQLFNVSVGIRRRKDAESAACRIT